MYVMYSNAMNCFQDIIGFWETTADFARDMGVPYGRARKWRDRNSIPSIYWSRLVRIAGEAGLHKITFDKLMEMSAYEAAE